MMIPLKKNGTPFYILGFSLETHYVARGKKSNSERYAGNNEGKKYKKAKKKNYKQANGREKNGDDEERYLKRHGPPTMQRRTIKE